MPSDRDLVACNEVHEMEYILKKYFKRTTSDNVDKMKIHCKTFKSKDEYKPHNRENYYRFLNETKALDEMD